MKHANQKPSLSLRLSLVCQAVEELITSGILLKNEAGDADAVARDKNGSAQSLCDVGCDHGLVPIALLKSGVIHSAVGLDVRQGPLERAGANREAYEISEETLSLRLSDGLSGLREQEAEIVVIAGMGGLLIRDILEQADLRKLGVRALVLSPHTKQMQLRTYLRTNGLTVCAEKEVCDDGKYYPIISVYTGNGVESAEGVQLTAFVQKKTGVTQETALRLCDRFGPILLTTRNEVLHACLLKRERELGTVMNRINGNGSHAFALQTELADVQEALKLWKERQEDEHALQ